MCLYLPVLGRANSPHPAAARRPCCRGENRETEPHRAYVTWTTHGDTELGIPRLIGLDRCDASSQDPPPPPRSFPTSSFSPGLSQPRWAGVARQQQGCSYTQLPRRPAAAAWRTPCDLPCTVYCEHYAVLSHYWKQIFCENSNVRGFIWSS